MINVLKVIFLTSSIFEITNNNIGIKKSNIVQDISILLNLSLAY